MGEVHQTDPNNEFFIPPGNWYPVNLSLDYGYLEDTFSIYKVKVFSVNKILVEGHDYSIDSKYSLKLIRISEK